MADNNAFDYSKLRPYEESQGGFDPSLVKDKPTGFQSLMSTYKDYMKGYGSELAQTGATGGYHAMMAPSYAYEFFSGKPLYELEKPDVTKIIPEVDSDAYRTGKTIGGLVETIGSAMLPITRGAKAIPWTRSMAGKRINDWERIAAQSGANPSLGAPEISAARRYLGAESSQMEPEVLESLLSRAQQGGVSPMLDVVSALSKRVAELGKTQGRAGASYARSGPKQLQDQILSGIQRSVSEAGMPEHAARLPEVRDFYRQHHAIAPYIKDIIKALAQSKGATTLGKIASRSVSR